MISFSSVYAQLKWYAVNQKGIGITDLIGNTSVNKWTKSSATISIDENNSNIYIYDGGKSKHFEIIALLKKEESAKADTKIFEAANEEGIKYKIGLTKYKGIMIGAKLSVYMPDRTVIIYKITANSITQQSH
jgi:hypothetical protein